MARRRYVVLDGYRGVAAITVVFFHATASAPVWIAAHGYLAVDFFFRLSGFVVASAYEARLRAGLGVAAFMRIRLSRLYPLVALAAAIGAICLVGRDDPNTLALLLASGLVLVPTPLGAAALGHPLIAVNPASWSLLWELVVNLAYAVLVPHLTGGRLAMLIGFAFAALAMMTIDHGRMDVGSLWASGWGGLPRAGFSFFAGVALCRLRAADRLPRGIAPPVGLALLVAVLMLPYGQWWAPGCDLFIVALAFPTILAGAADAAPGKWTALCALGGALSYPAYILQGGVDPLLAAVPTAFGVTGWSAMGLIALAVAAYLGGAFVVLKTVDEPIQRYLASHRLARTISRAEPA